MQKNKTLYPIARALLAASCLLGAHAMAETVTVPLGQQGKAWNVKTPRHAATKEEVQAQFGGPISKKGPVGDPAIYTWEYEEFDVYFEGEHVIHAVVKVDPANAE